MAKRRVGSQLGNLILNHKSRELPQFPCVQVVYDISLERSWRGIQLCFRLHLNQRCTRKVMGSQNRKNFNCGEFRDSHLGVLGQNDIWMLVMWPGIEYTIRGKVVVSPKSGSWWVLWVRVCLWFVLKPKVFQLCTNQLVVWFCASPCEWMITCHFS